MTYRTVELSEIENRELQRIVAAYLEGQGRGVSEDLWQKVMGPFCWVCGGKKGTVTDFKLVNGKMIAVGPSVCQKCGCQMVM
jgi:hypothetical protein